MTVKRALYALLGLVLLSPCTEAQPTNPLMQLQQRMEQQFRGPPGQQAPQRQTPLQPPGTAQVDNFQIVALINFSHVSVDRKIDGGVNIRGQMIDGKQNQIPAMVTGIWSAQTINYPTRVLSQLNIATSMLPKSNRMDRELEDLRHLNKLIMAAFVRKNPGIVGELTDGYYNNGDISSAAVIFVPRAYLNAPIGANMQRSIEQKQLGVVGTITLEDVANANAGLIAEESTKQTAKATALRSLLTPSPGDLDRYSALSVAEGGLVPKVCAIAGAKDMPERVGLLEAPEFVDWMVAQLAFGNVPTPRPDLKITITLANLDEVFASITRRNCHVYVDKVANLSKIAAAASDANVPFKFFETFVDAQTLRRAYAKQRGFSSTDDFDFAASLGANVTATDIQQLRQLQVQNPSDVQAALARMKATNYQGGTSVRDVIQFVGDEQDGAKSGRSAQQVRNDAAESADKAENDRLVALAAQFPYQAIIVCGRPGITVLGCFNGRSINTELELRNGTEYGLYKVYQIMPLGSITNRGFSINLRKNFEIKMQNASDTLSLSLRIVDTKTKQEVFHKDAGQFGFISVRN